MDTGIFKGMLLVGSKGHQASVTAPKHLEPILIAKKEMVKPSAVEKPRGRPNVKEAKKQARKEQMSALDTFIESKPSKNKVREYFEMRVKQLKDD